jgi:hypothetical protein
MKAGELAAILLTDPEALVVIPGYEGQLDEAKVVMKTTVSESPSGEYYGTLDLSNKETSDRCFYLFNKRHDDYFPVEGDEISGVEKTILLDEQVRYD